MVYDRRVNEFVNSHYRGIRMSSQVQERPVFKYLILYGSVYLVAYTMITGFSSVFKIYLGYATIPLLVAVFTAYRYAKTHDSPLSKADKVKFISGAFICTVTINILFTAEIIGNLRSVDHLDGEFILRQLMQLVALWFIFGTDYFYSYLKKQYK